MGEGLARHLDCIQTCDATTHRKDRMKGDVYMLCVCVWVFSHVDKPMLMRRVREPRPPHLLSYHRSAGHYPTDTQTDTHTDRSSTHTIPPCAYLPHYCQGSPARVRYVSPSPHCYRRSSRSPLTRPRYE